MAVGKALSTIRDQRLYREGFKTFKDYCKEKWGMGRNLAHKLMDGQRWRTNLVLPRGNNFIPLVKSSQFTKNKSAPWSSLNPTSSARSGRKL